MEDSVQQASLADIVRANRVRELSRMSKNALRTEERRVLERNGYRRIYGGPGTKDELIASILRIEEGRE